MNLYHKDKKYPYDKDSQIKYVEDPYIFSLKDKKKGGKVEKKKVDNHG